MIPFNLPFRASRSHLQMVTVLITCERAALMTRSGWRLPSTPRNASLLSASLFLIAQHSRHAQQWRPLRKYALPLSVPMLTYFRRAGTKRLYTDTVLEDDQPPSNVKSKKTKIDAHNSVPRCRLLELPPGKCNAAPVIRTLADSDV